MNQNTYSLVMAFCRPAAAMIATLATMLGFALDTESVATIVCGAASIVLICWSSYKNNDFTEAAALGTELMKVAKAHGENAMDTDVPCVEDDAEAEDMEEE